LVDEALIIKEENFENALGSAIVGEFVELVLVFGFRAGLWLFGVGRKSGIFGKGKV